MESLGVQSPHVPSNEQGSSIGLDGYFPLGPQVHLAVRLSHTVGQAETIHWTGEGEESDGGKGTMLHR